LLPLPIPDVPGWIGLATPLPGDNCAADNVLELPKSFLSESASTDIAMTATATMLVTVERVGIIIPLPIVGSVRRQRFACISGRVCAVLLGVKINLPKDRLAGQAQWKCKP
jgi:hypothetical protein